MPFSLSKPARFLIGGLLVLLLIGQVVFSSTYLAAQSYAHNGRISHKNLQWKETSWYYTQASQWYPYDHHWWHSIGVAEKEMRQWEPSINAMEQSLIHAPYFVMGYVRAATLKYQAKDIATADHLVNQVDALVPRHREVNYLQGLLLANAGKMEKATAHLLESRRDATTPHASIELLLAHTATKTGRDDVALAAAQRVTTLEPGVPDYWLQLGKIYRRLDQPTSAIGAYEKSLAVYEKNYAGAQLRPTVLPSELISIYLGMGDLYVSQQQYNDAIDVFYAVSELYSTIPQSKKALDAIAIHSKNSRDTDRLKRACVLSAGRRWAEAGALFSGMDFSAEAQQSPTARYHYAMVLRNSGQLEAALTQFRAMNTQAFIPSLAYADSLKVAGQPAAARFEYAKMLTFYDAFLTSQQRQEISTIIAQLTP